MTAAQIVQAFVQCGGALALVALLYSLFRRLDYLSAQLVKAKGEDRWSDRCSGCGIGRGLRGTCRIRRAGGP